MNGEELKRVKGLMPKGFSLSPDTLEPGREVFVVEAHCGALREAHLAAEVLAQAGLVVEIQRTFDPSQGLHLAVTDITQERAIIRDITPRP